MAGDDLRRIEAIFNTVAKIASGEDESAIVDARCPKCKASEFTDLPDLYNNAVRRIEEDPAQADAVAEGGLTNMQMAASFAPPQKKSPIPRVLLYAIPLGAIAAYVYQRFGPMPGQFAVMGAIVITVGVLLTNFRRVSDDFYARRRQWRHRYMCRKCGQLVEV